MTKRRRKRESWEGMKVRRFVIKLNSARFAEGVLLRQNPSKTGEPSKTVFCVSVSGRSIPLDMK